MGVTNMDNMPYVSVIIPVFNDSKYIGECLESVINQSLKQIEIICVNDGSTDNSLEIITQYASQDERIRVFTQANKGRSATRNFALSKSTGMYIAFIDADDTYPNIYVLEKLFEESYSRGLDLCRGVLLRNKNGNTEIVKNDDIVDDENYFMEGVHYTDMNPVVFGWTSYFYKASLLRDNNICFDNIEFFEDPLFLARVFACTDKYYHINHNVYLIRGMTHPKKLTMQAMMDVLYSLDNITLVAVNCENDSLFINAYKMIMENESLFHGLCRLFINNPDYVISVINNIEERISKRGLTSLKCIQIEEIREFIESAKNYEFELSQLICNSDSIIIYGAGIFGLKVKYFIETYLDKKADGFAVSTQGAIQEIDGLPCKTIFSWIDICASKKNRLFIVAVNSRNRKEIEEVLHRFEVKNVIYFDMMKWLVFHDDYFGMYPDEE